MSHGSYKNFLIGLSFFALAEPFAFAGGISSSGAENHRPTEAAAWFLGERPVRYCSATSPDFGKSEQEIRNTLRSAMEQWKTYLAEKKVNESGVPHYSNENTLVGHAKIVLNSIFIERCDGTEDLKFYFGAKTAEVQKNIRDFQHPTAFAQRTQYDAATGWGKGFIWIAPAGSIEKGAPNWQLPHRLHGILLHEIGHVLGNSHIGGTIMHESMGAFVLADGKTIPTDEAKGLFTQIDNRKELYLCDGCEFRFEGNPNGSLNENAFHLLTGKAPQGEVRSWVVSKGPRPFLQTITLTLADSTGEYSFQLDEEWEVLNTVYGDTDIFKKAMFIDPKAAHQLTESTSLHSNGVSYLMGVTPRRGDKLKVVLSRNMGVSPLSIQVTNHALGKNIHLFLARTY